MSIDLSALDKLITATEPRKGVADGKDTETEKSGAEGKPTPYKGKRYIRLEEERETARRLSAAYKTYQDNIKRGGSCMVEITKGIQEGADLYTLLLLAMEGLSKMTGNSLFYDQGKADLQAIYGALGYNAPIAQRTQEVQERLNCLCNALERAEEPGDRDRITRAIRAHRLRLEQLAERMKEANRAGKTN